MGDSIKNNSELKSTDISKECKLPNDQTKPSTPTKIKDKPTLITTEDKPPEVPSSTVVETVFKNTKSSKEATEIESDLKLNKPAHIFPASRALENKNRVASATAALEKAKIVQKPGFRETEPNVMSLFSVNGAPSRRVFRRLAVNSDIFSVSPCEGVSKKDVGGKVEGFQDKPSNCELRRPSSAFRNPLTGTGVNSNDEYKYTNKKKVLDGNPVLGLGYDINKNTAAVSNHRIPPGGYSHKLW